MYQNSSLFTPSHAQAITNPSVHALFTEKPSILIYFDPFRQKLWLQLKILDPLLDSPRPTIRNLRVSRQTQILSRTVITEWHCKTQWTNMLKKRTERMNEWIEWKNRMKDWVKEKNMFSNIVIYITWRPEIFIHICFMTLRDGVKSYLVGACFRWK